MMRLRIISFLFGAMMICAAATPAHALNEDPFALDGGKWMSFDRYKDTEQRLPQSPPPPESPQEEEIKAESTPAPQAPTTIVEAERAALQRPINIPVMPGVNKGFDVHVTSTADEDSHKAIIANMESEPTIELPASNWQTPEEATQHLEETAIDEDSENPKKILNVRMSYLPNPNIRPEEKPETKVAQDESKSLFSPKKDPAKVEKAAACAAIDAHKKQQLAAIKSDNQTLSALQAAIAELGLQKELSFMTGENSSVTVNTPPPTTTIK